MLGFRLTGTIKQGHTVHEIDLVLAPLNFTEKTDPLQEPNRKKPLDLGELRIVPHLCHHKGCTVIPELGFDFCRDHGPPPSPEPPCEVPGCETPAEFGDPYCTQHSGQINV